MHPVHEAYGNRVRVRVCGILIENGKILMVNHHMPGGDFWAPPGGGVEFGESAETTLQRELLEETGLTSTPAEFLFACEFIQKPLHAVELFFLLKQATGNLITGHDPELPERTQIIDSVRFMDATALRSLPPSEIHGIFQQVEEPLQVAGLRGFFKL